MAFLNLRKLFPGPPEPRIVEVDYKDSGENRQNFLIQSEHMSSIKLECPEGFVQFQDSCIPEE